MDRRRMLQGAASAIAAWTAPCMAAPEVTKINVAVGGRTLIVYLPFILAWFLCAGRREEPHPPFLRRPDHAGEGGSHTACAGRHRRAAARHEARPQGHNRHVFHGSGRERPLKWQLLQRPGAAAALAGASATCNLKSTGAKAVPAICRRTRPAL